MNTKTKLLLLAALAALLVVTGCVPGETVLQAQSLPLVVKVGWNANPTGEGVTGYTVKLDSATGIDVVASTACTSGACEQAITITSAGSHTLTLVATNQWGVSPATSITFSVVVPTAPGGLKVTK